MKIVLTRATIIFILIIILLILGFLFFPLSKIVTKKRVIIIENYNLVNQYVKLKNNEENVKIINALILGIPGEGNSAPNLTDTLMVANINQRTKEGFVLSIPRDLWVKERGRNTYTKINAVYQNFGLDTLKNILNEITGLNFTYSVIVDLNSLKQVIDQLNGIDVYVEKDIYDPAFPGPNNSYEIFTLKAGWQHLNGETALKYVRSRHDTWGDFSRMNRQQQVLGALKEKISSLHPFWNLSVILSIWRAITSHVKTNISLIDIKTFWQIVKDIDLQKIKFRVLDQTTNLLVPDHVLLGNQKVYILKPRAGLDNYTEIREYVSNLINSN